MADRYRLVPTGQREARLLRRGCTNGVHRWSASNAERYDSRRSETVKHIIGTAGALSPPDRLAAFVVGNLV